MKTKINRTIGNRPTIKASKAGNGRRKRKTLCGLEAENGVMRERVEYLEEQLTLSIERADFLARREEQLRVMLLEVHAKLLPEAEPQCDARPVCSESADGSTGRHVDEKQVRRNLASYRRAVARVREVVDQFTPKGARVIVIDKGDEELVKLAGRNGWHFPQEADGTYAGHYPADSAAAIEHLEVLRSRGGQYLAIPSTAFWWQEQYIGFGRHLQNSFQQIHADAWCRLFRLEPPASEKTIG